jgi:hypothetical protein
VSSAAGNVDSNGGGGSRRTQQQEQPRGAFSDWRIWSLLYRLSPVIFVAAAFVTFVVVNGGVVVGDRDNHPVTAHLAQFWYLVLCK